MIREKILWIVVSLSLGAGLMAAYGRERHDGRRPDRSWLFTRLYIFPFLGIVTGWLVSRFNLTNNDAAILSAILALLGYEALRIITDKSRKGLEVIGERVIPDASRPFHSLVDTDNSGRAAAHVELSDPAHPRRSAVGGALRDSFTAPAVATPAPELDALIGKLDETDPDEI